MTDTYIHAVSGAGGGGGGGITALTGDVSASGSGTVVATVNSVGGSTAADIHTAEQTVNGTESANLVFASPGSGSAGVPTFRALVGNDIPLAPAKRYVDFLSGDDTGTGSLESPWKTLQHAYDTVTDVSINKPYVFYISGGNNDSDSSTITGKPNVSLEADYPIQVNNLVISGGSTNDGVTFTNIIFLGGPTWIRNDGTFMGITFDNCSSFSGPVLKQTGAGSAFVQMNGTTCVNSEFLAAAGIVSTSCTFIGTTTFDDPVSSSAYYQISGGYIGGAVSISGPGFLYLAGMIADVPYGYSLTVVTTVNGTITLQTDSGSTPPSITGSPTLYYASVAQHEGYTPAVSGNWSVQPATVQQALDMIAAKIGPV